MAVWLIVDLGDLLPLLGTSTVISIAFNFESFDANEGGALSDAVALAAAEEAADARESGSASWLITCKWDMRHGRPCYYKCSAFATLDHVTEV